jgi:hypothetical protein
MESTRLELLRWVTSNVRWAGRVMQQLPVTWLITSYHVTHKLSDTRLNSFGHVNYRLQSRDSSTSGERLVNYRLRASLTSCYVAFVSSQMRPIRHCTFLIQVSVSCLINFRSRGLIFESVPYYQLPDTKESITTEDNFWCPRFKKQPVSCHLQILEMGIRANQPILFDIGVDGRL